MSRDDSKIIRLDNLYRSEKLKKDNEKKLKRDKIEVNKRKALTERKREVHREGSKTNQRTAVEQNKTIYMEDFDYREYLNNKGNNEERIKKTRKRTKKSDELENKKETSNIKGKPKANGKNSSRAKSHDKEEKPKKKRRRSKASKIFFTILLILMLIVPSFYFLLTSTFFNIVDVSVNGTLAKYTKEDIIKASNIYNGENIFKVSFFNTEKKIKQMAYIKDAKIHLNLPNKIIINAEERVPYAIIQTGNESTRIIVDKEKYFLEFVTDETKLTLPTIYDTDLKSVPSANEIGKMLQFKGEYIVPNTLILLDYFENAGLKKDIKEFRYNVENTVIVLNNGTKINFGTAENIPYKIKLLQKILDETKNQEGIIDLNKSNPTFIPKAIT